MTGKERIIAMLNHEKTDVLPTFEHFWDDTKAIWKQKGFVDGTQELEDVFKLDMRECWAFNLVINLDAEEKIIAEDEDTITKLDKNYAILRRHKKHDTTPEHVDFTIKNREEWDKYKKYLTPDRSRIDFEKYRSLKKKCEEEQLFFVWSGINVFECIHPIAGHEHMLIGMLDDPEWIEDMVNTYSNLIIELQKILFEEEGYPDGIWYYEDMGYKGSPFMSPAHYEELIKPGHIKTIKYAHDNNLPVIMHSCGFIEPLLEGMIDAGIDCLQVIEVKAGMDLLRINEKFGKQISFMGGVDVRALYSNDKDIIDKELEKIIPAMKKYNNFCLHSDHSIPNTVDFDSLVYFHKKAQELYSKS